jgi:hypothetical protein
MNCLMPTLRTALMEISELKNVKVFATLSSFAKT